MNIVELETKRSKRKSRRQALEQMEVSGHCQGCTYCNYQKERKEILNSAREKVDKIVTKKVTVVKNTVSSHVVSHAGGGVVRHEEGAVRGGVSSGTYSHRVMGNTEEAQGR